MNHLSQLVSVEPWERDEGCPSPMGATWLEAEQAWNFALFSRHATAVTLLLYRKDDAVHPVHRLELDPLRHKSAAIWHCLVPLAKAPDAAHYAWRVDGPRFPDFGMRFNPAKVLLDPFAREVFFPTDFSREAACGGAPNDGCAPLGVLPRTDRPFDWRGVKPPRHTHDTVVYELHVKGFTARANSGVSPRNRGTFAGLVEKIPYLTELGVTVVELMPVQQFDPQEGSYWGYMPLNFFSPHHGYAGDGSIREFREMVRAFHAAGIEVWMDVVYNHTAEGDGRGPCYSFRGVDNTSYYIVNPDGSYHNDSGCGNTIRCSHPIARVLILNSLRHWATDMEVDGFRFDLASIFARDAQGRVDTDQPALVHEIGAAAALHDVRLVAEAWDMNACLLGRSFPGLSWWQWNGRFRDDLRAFVRGDPGMVGSLMTRIYGSDDLFPDKVPGDVYHPYQSVNFITSHDGFCLYDLVSYDHKRNLANGHGNRDGSDNNLSWNCGWDGDVNVPPEIMALRRRQVKNFFALLMLSNGTPMFCAGDEFLNTQQGNNNPYNQDNEITWLDWDLLRKNLDVFRFFQGMIALRKSRRMLGRSRFWREDVRWFGTVGGPDLGHESRHLAWRLSGARFGEGDLYVMVNAHPHPLRFHIQEGSSEEWKRLVDTTLTTPDDLLAGHEAANLGSPDYELDHHGVAVFVRSA